MIGLLALLAAQAAVPPSPASADVPPAREAAWTACRNEKLTLAVADEMKGCEELIAAGDVDDGIKAVAHANRGMLMGLASQFAAAKEEMDTAIKLNPKLAPAYYNRALLAASSGDTKAAVADYTKAIEIVPVMTDAYINRGIIYATSGRNEAALADFNKAIELEPGSADLYENRAQLLQAMGRPAEAEADLAKAKELAK